MHLKKKISLFAVSLALVLVLLNAAPQVAIESGVDLKSPQHEYSLSATPIPPDLVAYWQMNEGGGPVAFDTITPANDGHLDGPYTWPTGVAGTALQLDRYGWADCGNNPQLILTNDLTIEAWIKLPDFLPGQVQTIIENRFALNPKVFHFGVQDGRLYYDRYNPGQEVLSAGGITPNTWHHVAAVVSRGQQTVTFYINGTGEQPIPYNDGVYGGAGFTYLGVENPPGIGQSYWYQGSMDEVAVWRRLLSGPEIQEHYQKGLLGLGYLEDIVVNNPPVAVDDAYATDEDIQLNVAAPGILANDYDDDGDSLDTVLVTGPTDGTLTLNLDGGFTYLPDPDYSGLDSFTYRARDGVDESNTATVTITVNPVNDAPIAADDAYNVDEDSVLNVGPSGVLSNDQDIDGPALEAYPLSGPANGLLTLNLDGSFDYQPNSDYFGPDEFTYHVYDGLEYSNVATVMITVNNVNDIPDANDDSYTADEGFILIVDALSGVLSNDEDIDGDSLTAELVDWPAFGTLTLYPDGSFEYFVDGWSGPVIFTYTVFDGAQYSPLATVIIDVIGDDDETGPEITITYAGSSTDGDPGTWTVDVFDPESGVDTVTVEIDGAIVGTAAGIYAVPNSLGAHTITVTATNADLDTGPADQETSTLSDTVTIVDDDVTGPSIVITYAGDATDVNPGLWTVTVYDTISGILSIVVEIDGVAVGTLEGDYAVPSVADDHTITVTAHNNDLDRESDQETSIQTDTVTIVDTTPLETLIELSGATAGAYSDPVYLEARLIDTRTGVPIPGKWIVFTVGIQAVEAITDSSGIASYILVLDQQPGVYTLSASFAGDDDYPDSSAMCEFVIAKEYAHAEYTGRTIIPTSDDTLTLMATIFDEDDGYWGDLTRIYVTFTMYLSSELVYDSGPIMVGTTDVAGVGLATIEIPNLDAGEYLVVVSFNPLDNRYYYGPTSEATITIYEPELESVSGAGWIKDTDGNRVFFVFNVKYNCKGNLKGFLLLTYRVHESVYIMRTTKILSFTVDGNHAFFEADGRISEFNFHKHRRHCPTETFRFRVDVWDNKKSHDDDAFQIRVFDKNGLVEYKAGYDPFGILIRGNIKINQKRHRYW